MIWLFWKKEIKYIMGLKKYLGNLFFYNKPEVIGNITNKYKFPLLYHWGYINSINVEKCGLLRIDARFLDEHAAFNDFRVLYEQQEIPLLNGYKIYRLDSSDYPQLGTPCGEFVLEYSLHPIGGKRISNIIIEYRDGKILDYNCGAEIIVPHYNHFFAESSVLHRDQIYGYGPPSRSVSPEVFALTRLLKAPILDFGCGSGALVRSMRSAGLDAFGIELRRQDIINSLFDDTKPYITLYDGNIPLPFEDCSFESGICTEVLEHIPDYEGVVSELARILRKRLIVTVPDISAIPICYPHNVVPWHLLESTHVNFFTQSSLFNILFRYFKKVEFARIGLNVINGTKFYDHLVAISDK